jgi:amino acid transporter
VRQLAASIFNYTVCSGIFALPALAVARLGSAAPLAYLACAVVMACVVLCFAEAGSRVAQTGGPYAYVEVALGPFVGFFAGALLLLTGLSAGAAVTVVFAHSVDVLLGTHSARLTQALILVILATLAALNVRGVRTGARLIEAVTIAKLLPLIAFVLIGAAYIRPEHLVWSATPGISSVLGTAGIVIFAFSGIESALTPSGEVRSPSRTVPRAAFLALGAATALYLAIQWVALGIEGTALGATGTTPLAAAAGAVAGPAGRLVMLAGASVSMFGYLTSNLLSVPRSLFAFSRDGLLPRALSRVHARYRTPYVAIGVYTIVVAILALSGTFERLAVFANLTAFVLYILCAIAVWVLRRRDVRADGEPFVIPGGPLVPIAACATSLWLIIETAGRTDAWGLGAALLVATALYLLRAYRRHREHLP